MQRTAQRIEVIINIRRRLPVSSASADMAIRAASLVRPALRAHGSVQAGWLSENAVLIQRLRSTNRIILQPFKLTDVSLTDCPTARSICAAAFATIQYRYREMHRSPLPAPVTPPCMLRDAITGKIFTERPQLPGVTPA